MKKTNLATGITRIRRMIPQGVLALLFVALQAESQQDTADNQKRAAQMCDPDTGGSISHNPAPQTQSKQEKMISVFDKLDQMDKQDLLDALDKANDCTYRHDFEGAKAALREASMYSHGAKDENFIRMARERMNKAKDQQQREQWIAARNRDELKKEQARAKQAQADERRRRRLQELDRDMNDDSDQQDWVATAVNVLDQFGKNMDAVYEQQKIEQQNQHEYEKGYKKLQQQVTENARRQQERVAEQRRQEQRADDALRRQQLANNQRAVDEYERKKRQEQGGQQSGSINPWNEGFAALNDSSVPNPGVSGVGSTNITGTPPSVPVGYTRLPTEFVGQYEYTTGAWHTRVRLNEDGTGLYWVQTLKNWNNGTGGYAFHNLDRQAMTWTVDTRKKGENGSMFILYHLEDGKVHPEAKGLFGSKTYLEGGHRSALLSKKNGIPYFGRDLKKVESAQW